MGTFAGFDRLCRLCGLECYDLIDLFEDTSHDRNLVQIIKKYIRVAVSLQDSLPRHICGPCLAKLDEVVDFVDASQTAQSKLRNQLKEYSTEGNVRVSEDQLYELIQDVKVELEESETQFIDDVNDEDYGPQTSKRRRRKARGLRGRSAVSRGSFGRQPKKFKNKQLGEAVADGKKEEVCSKLPTDTEVKTEEWTDSHEMKSSTTEASETAPGEEEGSLSASTKMGNSLKTVVRCSLCKISFSHFEQLATHSMEVHQLLEHRYMCPQCPQIFHKITSLNNHQRRKHQDSLQGCPQCSKLYPAHYLWTRHILVHTNTRPFACDECEKKFKSKAELYNHKRIHRPSEERYTHCCEICGKRFTQKANLESHLRLHTGNRPFSCEFCGKCFSQRGNMEEHRRIHTGEKPFICDICGTSYSRQGQLAMHRRQHNGEKPHKCQYCEKEFLRREVLKKHEHMHTDTRPYKCSYCEKCFRDQGKRKVHERLHTGERPFECQFCGRGFCESGNLRKHLRVHQRRPGSVLSSSAKDKNTSSYSVASGPPVVSGGGPSFNYAPAVHANSAIPGLVVARHSADVITGNPSGLALHGAPSLTPNDSHSVSQSLSQGVSGPLPLSGNLSSDTQDHPLVTLHPVEGSQESSALPLQQGCEREEDYRVSSSSYQAVTWTVYQT